MDPRLPPFDLRQELVPWRVFLLRLAMRFRILILYMITMGT